MSGEKHIGNVAAIFLIVSAVCIDVLQVLVDLLAFIPIVGFVIAFLTNVFIDICAWLFFAITFLHINFPVMKKRPLGFLGTLVMENIPYLNALPGWTLFVVTTIMKDRAEKILSSRNEQPQGSLAFGEL